MRQRSYLRSATLLTSLGAVLTLGAACERAAAADNSGLPILSACQPATQPVLPQRWRAVGLMLPYLRKQLVVGEFVRDGAARAMRATLIGLESGNVDLLITDKETYRLSGPHDAPNACTALGHEYDPPPDNWLAAGSTCDGEAPVGTKAAQWWKSAAPDGRAIWQWYRTDTRLPWRIMFPTPSAQPAVIGDYAMTYFPVFQSLATTNLARLRDFCAAKAQKTSPAELAAAAAPDIDAAERAKQVQALIPGLSRQACSTMSAPPHWPNQFVMTAILTPIQFRFTPLPTMLYYDWEGAGMLVGMMNEARTLPPRLELQSFQTRGVGYGIERMPNGVFACKAATPGVVRPNWMSAAQCECSGVIDHNVDFGANEVSVIRACPVRGEGLHVNWSWYTTEGRPILFTEPEAIGLGLNIADYHRWLPGVKMSPDAFELPAICTPRATEFGLPPVGEGLPPEKTENCSDCHTTRQ